MITSYYSLSQGGPRVVQPASQISE